MPVTEDFHTYSICINGHLFSRTPSPFPAVIRPGPLLLKFWDVWCRERLLSKSYCSGTEHLKYYTRILHSPLMLAFGKTAILIIIFFGNVNFLKLFWTMAMFMLQRLLDLPLLLDPIHYLLGLPFSDIGKPMNKLVLYILFCEWSTWWLWLMMQCLSSIRYEISGTSLNTDPIPHLDWDWVWVLLVLAHPLFPPIPTSLYLIPGVCLFFCWYFKSYLFCVLFDTYFYYGYVHMLQMVLFCLQVMNGPFWCCDSLWTLWHFFLYFYIALYVI